VLLSVYGLKLLVDALKGVAQPVVKKAGVACLALFIGYGLWVNTAYAAYLYRYVKPLEYLSGAVDRDGYIARYRTEHDAFQYVNRTLDETALLYFIYLGKRGYYCDIPYVPDSGGTHLTRLLYKGNELRRPDEAADVLRREGITHLVINMNITWPHVTENGGPGEAESLSAFLTTETRQVFSSRGVLVFALK
jgi:hypothetical protein